MLDHVGAHVNDLQKSKEFYSKALAPLGYGMTGEFPEWSTVGFGMNGKSDFWISGDKALQASHFAFAAKSREEVDAFYATGIAAGGTDNGAPGYRKDYSPGYYAAFVKDPDGHNIEVVFHDPSPSM